MRSALRVFNRLRGSPGNTSSAAEDARGAFGNSILANVQRWCVVIISELWFSSSRSAVLRRKGVYAPRNINFNDVLLDPYRQIIMPTWDSAFQTTLTTSFTLRATAAVRDFLDEVRRELTLPGMQEIAQETIQCLSSASNLVEDAVSRLKPKIDKIMQDARSNLLRQLDTLVERRMAECYSNALREKGAGSFARRRVSAIVVCRDTRVLKQHRH